MTEEGNESECSVYKKLHRRKLLAMGAAGMVTVLAGCNYDGKFEINTTGSWTVKINTAGSGTVDILNSGCAGDGELEFSVANCDQAQATFQFNDFIGPVVVIFDYESRGTSEYREIPFIQVERNGRVVLSEQFLPSRDNNPNAGRFSIGVILNQNSKITLGIKPSSYCSNPDHDETSFRVSNLEFSTFTQTGLSDSE